MIREGGLPFEMKVAPKELAASVNIADRERERERERVGTSRLPLRLPKEGGRNA